MSSMTPKVLAIGVVAAGLAFGTSMLNAQQRPGFSDIDKTETPRASRTGT